MAEKKTQPQRMVLPDFIVRTEDLTQVLTQTSNRLDINYVPESIACRDSEYYNVFEFIEDKLKHNTGGCLYISGVSGTGNSQCI